MAETAPLLKLFTNVFRESDLPLYNRTLRNASEKFIFITAWYQDRRDEVLDSLVEGLNRDLSPAIDVPSIGDQQRGTRRQKGIKIRHS